MIIGFLRFHTCFILLEALITETKFWTYFVLSFSTFYGQFLVSICFFWLQHLFPIKMLKKTNSWNQQILVSHKKCNMGNGKHSLFTSALSVRIIISFFNRHCHGSTLVSFQIFNCNMGIFFCNIGKKSFFLSSPRHSPRSQHSARQCLPLSLVIPPLFLLSVKM